MQPARSRFSHRHLLALCTFLVPLAMLAWLGSSELQRSSDSARASLEREARQFLVSAQQAIEQRIEQYVAPLLEECKGLLAQHGSVRTTIALAEQPRFAALRGFVMLDDQASVVWPALSPYSVDLPLVHDDQAGPDSPLRSRLQLADLSLVNGHYANAIRQLQNVVDRLVRANPPSDDRRPDLEATETVARFRLGTAHLALGAKEPARQEFERVVSLATNFRLRTGSAVPPLGLLAETAIAELDAPTERLKLLRAIAENRRETHTDGLLSAVAMRLAATFAAEDPARPEVDGLLREEWQRAAVRTFAAHYEQVVKPFVRMRRSRNASASERDGFGDERLVATVDGGTVLVCIRPATPEEAQQWNCTGIGVHLDLRAMLSSIWQPQDQPSATFVLAVHNPDESPIVAPPASATATSDFTPPTAETNGLTLHAYPADPARLVAEADASTQKRMLLMLALFMTALGGALWSWRSVSRETELASLKINLVSRVSHELKTPLALVRMYGETLSMGRARDSKQAAEFGGIIAREAERLTALIQRILDFSRQQAGTLAYTKEPIDLSELLRSVVAAYSPHLEARGAILIDSLPFGIMVPCDANACESAIVNLLENAAKYGQDGDTEHEIDLVLEQKGDHAIVEVSDRGRGIPERERERVFDGFYRASNAGEVRGAGLGLSLVRHFARAHGGEIQALPRDGGGTVMRLTLPLTAATNTTDPTAASTFPPAAGQPPATES